jgi:hypothetical protein
VGGDPDAVCVEAIEEGVGSRLPRVWWSGAVALLGDRWLGERPEVGVTLLSAAAHGPVMGPREPLSAALQASRGRLAPEVWARAEQGGRPRHRPRAAAAGPGVSPSKQLSPARRTPGRRSPCAIA